MDRARPAAIERRLGEMFEHFRVPGALGQVLNADSGHVFDRGWHFGFLWGEENGREFLELLSQHRMTDDEYIRIWADGQVEVLPTATTGFLIKEGEAPQDTERRREKFFEDNRQVSSRLRERGLLPPAGQNQVAQEVNEYLASGGPGPPGPSAPPAHARRDDLMRGGGRACRGLSGAPP